MTRSRVASTLALVLGCLAVAGPASAQSGGAVADLPHQGKGGGVLAPSPPPPKPVTIPSTRPAPPLVEQPTGGLIPAATAVSASEPVLGSPRDPLPSAVPAARAQATPESTPTTPTAAAMSAAADDQGSGSIDLPLTGLGLATLALVGLALVCAGLAMRPRRRVAAERR